jgi:hypothetical protein
MFRKVEKHGIGPCLCKSGGLRLAQRAQRPSQQDSPARKLSHELLLDKTSL